MNIEVRLPKIAFVRKHIPEIRQWLLEGYKLPDIVLLLKSKGLDITYGTLKNYLFKENITFKNLSKAPVNIVTPKSLASPKAASKLPEITCRADFRKLDQLASSFTFDDSPKTLAEARRILGEDD